MFLKKLKAFLSWNSFLTTTAECSFKHFNKQRPHALFKLKHFIFILKQAFKTTLITNKCTLQSYLAIYVQFLWRTLFTKATPTNLLICLDFNYHINERETLTTCLTNHKSSISHHIMPLVINSLGGGHTHTRILTSRTKAISRNQSISMAAFFL